MTSDEYADAASYVLTAIAYRDDLSPCTPPDAEDYDMEALVLALHDLAGEWYFDLLEEDVFWSTVEKYRRR